MNLPLHALPYSLNSLPARHLEIAGVIYACMDWRHMAEILAAGCTAHLDLLNLCVWVKSNGGMGSLYRSRHELIFVFRNGKEQHRNNVQLGRFGRNRTNVWNYAGADSFPRKGQESALDLHPTVKPIALVSDAILDSTKRNDIVLDPFCGSGTTLLAAERTAVRADGHRCARSQRSLDCAPGTVCPVNRVCDTDDHASGPCAITRGTHTITAFADDVDRIVEFDKTNNNLSQTITVP